MKTRTEKDFLGAMEIPTGALYGIHSMRAKSNFPINDQFPIEWYKAIGTVKLACYLTYQKFKKAIVSKYGSQYSVLKLMTDEQINALIHSSEKVSEGIYFDQFIVPATQGGAGTSINMNVNEIITNLALRYLKQDFGRYEYLDPIEQANIYQSTNDVIPSSLKLAIIQLLTVLEEKINELRFDIEKLEKQHRSTLRLSYTQMQEAVPSSYGILFSTYNEALSRDWWRVSKAFERIKVINLGGGATGTALAIPRFFVMEVTNTLQNICKLPLTRSENLADATNNADSFVEVHAILKAHAVNLEKIVSDMRLLSSNILVINEIEIPQKQTGSSIMPAKINPVIVEFVVSAVHKIYANDMLISSLSGLGCLDLNAYLPSIGNALIDSLKLLIACNSTLKENLFSNVKINKSFAEKKLFSSPSISTALTPFIGYHKAAELANYMKNKEVNIFKANNDLNLISETQLQAILKSENLLKNGFLLSEIFHE